MLKVFLLSFFVLLLGCQNKMSPKGIDVSKQPQDKTISSLSGRESPILQLKKDEDEMSKIRESIIQAINRENSKIQVCYDNIVSRELTPPQGKMVFDLEISPKGELTQLTVVKDYIKRSELFDCVSEILKGINFDVSNKIIQIEYEILFVVLGETIGV